MKSYFSLNKMLFFGIVFKSFSIIYFVGRRERGSHYVDIIIGGGLLNGNS